MYEDIEHSPDWGASFDAWSALFLKLYSMQWGDRDGTGTDYKTHLCVFAMMPTSYVKRNDDHLPRQARDTHQKGDQKPEGVFLAEGWIAKRLPLLVRGLTLDGWQEQSVPALRGAFWQVCEQRHFFSRSL